MLNFNHQYLHLIKQVLEFGDFAQSRNSAVLQYFCPGNIEVQDVSKEFPILSVRRIPFYKSFLETCFFLSGETAYESMPKILRESWWAPWAEQARVNNSWGKGYSYQMRYSDVDGTTEESHFDQWENLIQECIKVIKTQIINRKMVVSLWRKQDALNSYTDDPAALDSCHSTALVFNLISKPVEKPVNDGYAPLEEWFLDLHHTQRSLDLFLGTGSDLIYSGLLMHLLCQEITNRLYCVNNPESTPIVKPRKLVFTPSNTHIYESHISQVEQLLETNSQVKNYEPCTISLKGPIIDFSNFKTVEDAKQVASLINYKPIPGNYSAKLYG